MLVAENLAGCGMGAQAGLGQHEFRREANGLPIREVIAVAQADADSVNAHRGPD